MFSLKYFKILTWFQVIKSSFVFFLIRNCAEVVNTRRYLSNKKISKGMGKSKATDQRNKVNAWFGYTHKDRPKNNTSWKHTADIKAQKNSFTRLAWKLTNFCTHKEFVGAVTKSQTVVILTHVEYLLSVRIKLSIVLRFIVVDFLLLACTVQPMRWVSINQLYFHFLVHNSLPTAHPMTITGVT